MPTTLAQWSNVVNVVFLATGTYCTTQAIQKLIPSRSEDTMSAAYSFALRFVRAPVDAALPFGLWLYFLRFALAHSGLFFSLIITDAMIFSLFFL